MGRAYDSAKKGFDAAGIHYSEHPSGKVIMTGMTLDSKHLASVLLDGAHGLIVSINDADVDPMPERLEANVAKLCGIATDRCSRGCLFVDCDLHRVTYRANVLNNSPSPPDVHIRPAQIQYGQR